MAVQYPPPPLLLHPVLNLQYQVGWSVKIKWKIQACFTLYSKFWEYTCVKSYKIQLRVLLFLVLHQFLYKQISFFTTFKNFTEHYLQKIFLPNLTDSSKSPTPLMARQVFSSIFPKNPSEIFFSRICWQNPAKASFMYQQWTATVHIPWTDTLVFSSENLARTVVFTQASVIRCQ